MNVEPRLLFLVNQQRHVDLELSYEVQMMPQAGEDGFALVPRLFLLILLASLLRPSQASRILLVHELPDMLNFFLDGLHHGSRVFEIPDGAHILHV